ncbi:unnamed protein product, partial [Tuber aestivum]
MGFISWRLRVLLQLCRTTNRKIMTPTAWWAPDGLHLTPLALSRLHGSLPHLTSTAPYPPPPPCTGTVRRYLSRSEIFQ